LTLTEDGSIYLAHFNIGDAEETVTTVLSQLGLVGRYRAGMCGHVRIWMSFRRLWRWCLPTGQSRLG